MALPFVKWVGGKRELAPEVIARLRLPAKCYFEPFVGGGAVFFALEALAEDAGEPCFRRAILGDSCEPLVRTWRAVAANPLVLAEQLEAIQVCEDSFYAVREQGFDALYDIEVARRFIFLNKCGFNGLWRVNGEGQYNVSWGKKSPDFKVADRERLHDASIAIRRASAVIRCADFEDLLRTAGRGDVAYLDPPFFPVSESADFTSYSASGFDTIDQARVERVARAAADRGASVVLSNADVPAAHELYSSQRGWKVDVVQARRSVNSDGEKRGKVGELLIVSRRAEQLEL